MERRIRRLIVEVERHGLKWSSRPAPTEPGSAARTESATEKLGLNDAAALGPNAPCEICDCAWVLLRRDVMPQQEVAQADLLAVLHSMNLHAQISPSGQIWVCQRSLDGAGGIL